MNRPKLQVALDYFKAMRNAGSEEAADLLAKYEEMSETHGEFLAGRFIIEVSINLQDRLKGVVNG
jgi:hypothetical protein